MLLGVMLLYVGAVLVINGIWLIGQARAATLAPAHPESPGGEAVARAPAGHPTLIQNREIAILNIFTGFVGLVTATTLLIQGNENEDLASVRGGGLILLFAFTYLWVAYNQYVGADGRAFGWYCLFVAVTAVAAAGYTLDQAAGDDAAIWLGISWLAWAVLWFMFFLLLALQRPIARITGAVAIACGIGTAWVFGFLLLWGTVEF